VVDEDVLALSGDNNIYGYNFSAPNYLYKFGITRHIHQLLAGAPVAPDTFTLSEPITEYVAAKGFAIEQFVEGGSIGDMKKRCEQTEDSTERIGGKPKAFWDDWYARFDAERIKYKELFFAAGRSDDIDLNDPNWMITGFDEINNRPILTVIDQFPGLMTRGGDAQTFDDIQYEYLFQLYSEKYHDDPNLAYLRQPAS
jgi:hypothetical protein